MKVWRVIQLVLAIYGTWSIVQGINFNRAVDGHQCSQDDFPIDEYLSRQRSAHPAVRLQRPLYKQDARVITLLERKSQGVTGFSDESCSLTSQLNDPACGVYVEAVRQDNHFIF
ncbi:hypothetical protein [Pseudomonas sp. L1(2025)]|uniref:hypothetical protein n=1 Tax=Pseudomonas sp. L1(2025) TaxID=3449429 RepID=UPI003F68FA4B